MNKHPEIFFGFVLFGLVCLLVSCDGRAGQGDRIGDQSTSAVALNLPPPATDLSGWRNYIDRRTRFMMPSGWHFLAQENDASDPAVPTLSVLIKNTDKSVALGSVAPDSYYLRDEQDQLVLNEAMFASCFIAIQTEVYFGWQAKTWRDFFRAVYPGVVEEFAPVNLPFANAPEALVATRVTGIWRGEPRLLVRQGDAIYDFALFAPGEDKVVAVLIFSTFLANFQF